MEPKPIVEFVHTFGILLMNGYESLDICKGNNPL